MVQGQRAHEKQIVFPGVHHKINADLVHNNSFSLRRDGCAEELAVNLTADHQGLAEVGHAYLKAQRALFGADDCGLAERNRLGSLLGEGDLCHDHTTPKAVDDGTHKTLDYDQRHRPRTEAGDVSATVTDGCLGLQRVEKSRRQAYDVLHARCVVRGGILPIEVAVVSCDPVPDQAEDEPAESERSDEVQDHVTPSRLHEGGPYVEDVGEAVSVHHGAELNVAAAIFGHQAALSNTPL